MKVKQIILELDDAYSSHTEQNPEDSRPRFEIQTWVETWFSVLKRQAIHVIFKRSNKEVAFVYLGKQSRWYGDIYLLNQTGRVEDDQMWIEHNDIVLKNNLSLDEDASSKLLDQCREALCSYLTQQKRFHRLFISLSPSANWQTQHSLIWSEERENVAFVDLQQLRISNQEYIQSVSKNTKSAINRSLKYINHEYGPIKMSVIDTDVYDSLTQNVAPLHMQQWQDVENGSGFSNPLFCQFHKAFIEKHSESLRFEILAFHAGDEELGYLYLILQGKSVFFYLSAINYRHESNRFKPGLVIHKLAIEHYQSRQFLHYDFLAGPARYKQSLSNASYPLYTVELTNTSMLNRCLFLLHRAKTWMSKRL